jgi:hypothetical protein
VCVYVCMYVNALPSVSERNRPEVQACACSNRMNRKQHSSDVSEESCSAIFVTNE